MTRSDWRIRVHLGTLVSHGRLSQLCQMVPFHVVQFFISRLALLQTGPNAPLGAEVDGGVGECGVGRHEVHLVWLHPQMS